MPFDPDAWLAQRPPPAPPATGFDPDAYLRSAVPSGSKKGFDPDVYLGVKKPEEAAAPEGPGLLSRVGTALGQVGSRVARLAPDTEENRGLEAAIGAIQEGKDINEALQAPPVPPRPPGAFSRGFVSGTVQQNPGAAADFLEGFSHDAPEGLQEPMRAASQKVRDFSKDITPEGYDRLTKSMYDIRDVGGAIDWAAETIGQGVASTLPPLALGAAGALGGGLAGGPMGATVGGLAGASGASYVQNYGEVYTALKEAGIDPKTSHDYAKYATIPISALDVASLGTIVSRFGGAAAVKRELINSYAKRIAKTMAEGGATEFTTEAAQEALKDATVSVAADKPYATKEQLYGWLEAGVGGGLAGAAMGAPAGLVRAPATAPGVAPTAEQIAAAGEGLVAPAETPPPGGPPGAPAVVPSEAPPMAQAEAPPTGATIPGPVVPDLPTGATIPGAPGEVPTGAAVGPRPEAPIGAPIGAPPLAPPGQTRVAMDEDISRARAAQGLPALPSPTPDLVRGREIGDVANSDLLAQGPLDLRPGTGTIEVQEPAPFGRMARGTQKALITPQGIIEGGPGKGEIPQYRGYRESKVTGLGLFGTTPVSTRSFPTVHSSTLGEILPLIAPSYLNDKPVSRRIAQFLAQQLMRLSSQTPVHIVSARTMDDIAPGTLGVYWPTLSGHPTIRGPIAIRERALYNSDGFAYILLHEATHAVTADLIRTDPLVAERIRSLMDEARQYIAATPESEFQSGTLYGMFNEREFLAEAFSHREFQDFLREKQASRELLEKLGLQRKMSLWEAFKHAIRQMLGMPDTRETMDLLEATLRVGADVMDAQARHVEAMQKSFNTIEPGLQAVPRQDATRPVYDAISGLSPSHIAPDLMPEIKRQAGYADRMNRFYKWMVHAFQLGELNPHLMELQRYLEKMREAAVDESKIVDAATRVLKDWTNIGREQGERLIQLIDDVTNMVYRTPDEIRRGVARHPTAQEFSALVRKYKLNGAALGVFQKVNKMFNTFLDLSSGLAMQEAMKITDPVQRSNAVNAVRANVTALKSRPYFPFMRYGRHFVLVRNTAGRVVHREHFEPRGFRSAESFQRQAQAALARQFPAPQFTVELGLLPESAGPMVGMPGMMLDLMAQKLRLTPSQLQALEQLRFELAPAQSFQHRMQNKSYIKGYSTDFQRSFGQYFMHGAKWYVKTKYADGMRQDIKDLEAGSGASLTPIKRLKIRDFLNDHLENNFLNPAQDFITFKAGLVFYTLAYVPVSAAVNMSQIPMVSLPFLGAKFGDVRAAFALSKAIGTARNYYRKGGIAAMTSAEARALNYAIQTGRLEQTMGVELASWAQGGNLQSAGLRGTMARTVHSAVEKGMWMFSIAEKWNRRVTFAAARELALAQPNSKFVRETLTRYQDELKSMIKSGFAQHEAEAILVASHVVDQTQFMATAESRPRFMRGKLGSLFLYKRYVQGLLFLTANNKRDFAPRFMIMALAMGGLGGIPGYDDLKEIARLLGWWLFGKDFNVDREVRRLVRSMTDEKWAPDQVLHGLARIGFGVPWLLNMLGNAAGQSPTVNSKMAYPHGPDISRSVGTNLILPVEVGKLFGPPINDPAKAFGEQSARAGGVMGGLAFNFYRALASKDDPGDFKRWELMMPRFARNLSTAYRAYSEEKMRGRGDVATVRFDTRDPEHLGEIIGMAAGFQPRRLTAKWEELRDQSEVMKFYDTMRGMMLEQWTAAVRGGRDPKEMDRMRTATTEFNNNLPIWARGMALTSDTINKSVHTRLRTQELMEAGLPQQRAKVPIVQEMQRLHPESVIDVRKIPQ